MLGVVDRMPRIHLVQTRGAYPLRRAWERLSGRILDRIGSVIPQRWMAATARLEERRLQLEIEANPNDLALWDRAVRSRSRRLHLWPAPVRWPGQCRAFLR